VTIRDGSKVVVGGYSSVTALTFGARIRQMNKRQESEENRCNSDERL